MINILSPLSLASPFSFHLINSSFSLTNILIVSQVARSFKSGQVIASNVQTYFLIRFKRGNRMPLVFAAKTLTLSNVTRTPIGSGFSSIGVQIKAPKNNSGTIFIGAADVGPTTGYQLDPGESVFIPFDDPQDAFILAAVNGDLATLFAI